jgi:hypothetical protein
MDEKGLGKEVCDIFDWSAFRANQRLGAANGV